MGSPESEEAQNRLVAAKNRAVVVSVDYRRSRNIFYRDVFYHVGLTASGLPNFHIRPL